MDLKLPLATTEQRLSVLEATLASLALTQKIGLVVSLGMLGLATYVALRPPPQPDFVLDCYE